MTDPPDPWMVVEERIRHGQYKAAAAMLERLRPAVTDATDLAYLEERLAYIAELQAERDAWVENYLREPHTRYEWFPGKLTASLCAVVIATAIFFVRAVLHESTGWAVFAVTVLALPVLVVTSTEAWADLSIELPLRLRQVIAASSAGFFGYVTYRFGWSTTLICVGAFSVGLLLAAYPVYLVFTGWRSRGGRFDHL